MLTDGVDIHLPILLIQFNVVLHVIHKSYGVERKHMNRNTKTLLLETLKAS